MFYTLYTLYTAMKHLTYRQARLILVAITAVVCLLPSDALAADGSCPQSADEAISGALGNVRSRYRDKLYRYGLTESYFDETSGICDLMLLDVPTWTKYQIVYYRATGQIEWPRTMPKSVAEGLMQDRLIIHQHECSLGIKGKASAKKEQPRHVTVKSPRRERPKPKPLHQEYVPTPEEKANIDKTLNDARAANAAYEKNRKKPPVAQTSDFRQMAEFKRNGMSGDEIASRFGIDRVKEYNKSNPNNPIRTSRHSKPAAPGFSW